MAGNDEFLLKDVCTVTVNFGIHKKVFTVSKGENLLNILRNNNIHIDSYCSGKGICGKCKVRITGSTKFNIGNTNEKYLTKGEIENGFVLACLHNVENDIEVYIYNSIANYRINDDVIVYNTEKTKYSHKLLLAKIDDASYNLGFAVDIGTTTLAFSLVNLITGEIIDTYSIMNPQKSYGADTITRIQYTKDHQGNALTRIIRKKLQDGFNYLIERNNICQDNIKEIVLSGNTTMIYFLLGIDAFPLSISPFKTIDLKLLDYRYNEIFSGNLNCSIKILPGISAFIGSDIVSGLYAIEFLNRPENILFVDIGTNGEMAIKVEKKILTTSTAAGPAFEGANIRCGMSSLDGAVCHADWSVKDNNWNLSTVGNCTPAGLCGSGLIDLMAWIKRSGKIDSSGKLTNGEVPIYKDKNIDIKIYQEDIRQIQLAKSAIKSGIAVLVGEAGISFSEINTLYIAGTFGRYINIENSVEIGLIPEELKEKVVIAGNTSLSGCIRYLLEHNGDIALNQIKSMTEYIDLSSNIDFNNCFIEYMSF